MSDDEWMNEEPKKTKPSKRKESRSKSKSKSRKPVAEAASGWSNDIDGEDENGDAAIVPPAQSAAVRAGTRRATEEVPPTGIPTITADDGEVDDNNEAPPQVAAPPQFSVYQAVSYQEMENDFTRTRASRFIDSKIDIGILYNKLHLQEDLDAENQRLWEWDKVFVEVRKAIISMNSEL